MNYNARKQSSQYVNFMKQNSYLRSANVTASPLNFNPALKNIYRKQRG